MREEQSQEQYTPFEQHKHFKKAQWKHQKNKFDRTWTVQVKELLQTLKGCFKLQHKWKKAGNLL